MILVELKFERSKYDSTFPNNPLKGTATFLVRGEWQDTAIHMTLSAEQCDNILEICRSSIQQSVQKGLESVQNLMIQGDAPRRLSE